MHTIALRLALPDFIKYDLASNTETPTDWMRQ